jgi:hypothetical protein
MVMDAVGPLEVALVPVPVAVHTRFFNVQPGGRLDSVTVYEPGRT